MIFGGPEGGGAEEPDWRRTPCSPPQKAIFQRQNHKPSTRTRVLSSGHRTQGRPATPSRKARWRISYTILYSTLVRSGFRSGLVRSGFRSGPVRSSPGPFRFQSRSGLVRSGFGSGLVQVRLGFRLKLKQFVYLKSGPALS